MERRIFHKQIWRQCFAATLLAFHDSLVQYRDIGTGLVAAIADGTIALCVQIWGVTRLAASRDQLALATIEACKRRRANDISRDRVTSHLVSAVERAANAILNQSVSGFRWPMLLAAGTWRGINPGGDEAICHAIRQITRWHRTGPIRGVDNLIQEVAELMVVVSSPQFTIAEVLDEWLDIITTLGFYVERNVATLPIWGAIASRAPGTFCDDFVAYLVASVAFNVDELAGSSGFKLGKVFMK